MCLTLPYTWIVDVSWDEAFGCDSAIQCADMFRVTSCLIVIIIIIIIIIVSVFSIASLHYKDFIWICSSGYDLNFSRHFSCAEFTVASHYFVSYFFNSCSASIEALYQGLMTTCIMNYDNKACRQTELRSNCQDVITREWSRYGHTPMSCGSANKPISNNMDIISHDAMSCLISTE